MSIMNAGKFLSDAEDEHLNALLSKDQSRDGLMLTVLRVCGMRPNELLRLRRCDLFPEKPSILVHGSKNSNDRELPIRRDLFERLEAQAAGKDFDARIFDISYNRLGEIWRFYRPCKKPLKSLRHTLADRTYRKTKDIRIVQQTLGHKSITSTMIYQTYTYSQDELAKALL